MRGAIYRSSDNVTRDTAEIMKKNGSRLCHNVDMKYPTPPSDNCSKRQKDEIPRRLEARPGQSSKEGMSPDSEERVRSKEISSEIEKEFGKERVLKRMKLGDSAYPMPLLFHATDNHPERKVSTMKTVLAFHTPCPQMILLEGYTTEIRAPGGSHRHQSEAGARHGECCAAERIPVCGGGCGGGGSASRAPAPAPAVAPPARGADPHRHDVQAKLQAGVARFLQCSQVVFAAELTMQDEGWSRNSDFRPSLGALLLHYCGDVCSDMLQPEVDLGSQR
ncbi:hypothetical protein STEG23_003918 [Scotinomys teguina]